MHDRVPFLIAVGISRSDGLLLGKVAGSEDELGTTLPVIFRGPVPEGRDGSFVRGIGRL